MSEYIEQAEKFLEAHGLRFRATFKGDKCPAWSGIANERNGCPQCGAIHGDRYRVTISRKGGGRISFDFWNSQKDSQDGKEPTDYDVLACISGDVHCPEDFAEFCSEYGYEEDSRKAEATFRRCAAFGRRLRAFFTAEEIDQLQEIR